MRRHQFQQFRQRLGARLSQFRPRRRLVFNLLFILVPLALIPVILVGAAGYLRSRSLLTTQITRQLTAYESRQETNLNDWVREKNTRIANLSFDNNFRRSFETLANNARGTQAYVDARITALTILDQLNPNINQAVFNQFMLVTPEGRVLAATVNDWERLNLTGTGFFDGQITTGPLQSFFVFQAQPLYSGPTTEALEFQGVAFGSRLYMFTSMPYTDSDGETIGFVVAISEPFAIQGILNRDIDFVPQSEVYFVNLSNTDGTPLMEQSVGLTRLRGIVSIELSEGQRELIQAGPHSASAEAVVYQTFDGDDVVGLYTEMEALGAGMLVEVPQDTVYADINELLPFTVYLLLITTAILVAVITLAANTITRPIQRLTNASQRFADGDWDERAEINRVDEIGQLATAFNNMAGQLESYYRTLEYQIAEREQQLFTAAEVGSLATSADNLDDVISQTVNLLAERFSFYHVAVFLVDQAREWAVFFDGTGPAGRRLRWEGFRIALTAPSIITDVINNNQYRLVSNVADEPNYLPHELLSDTRSEIVIPITLGDEVLGVLDVQSDRDDQLDVTTGEVFQVLANQLAAAVQTFQLKESTEVDLQQVRNLYRASRRIAQSESTAEIFTETANAMRVTPWESALYVPDGQQLRLVEGTGSGVQILEGDEEFTFENLTTFPDAINVSGPMVRMFFEVDTPIIIRDLARPTMPIRPELLETPRHMNFREVAYIPLIFDDELRGLMLLGSRRPDRLSLPALQPVTNFNELVRIALEKVTALEDTQAALNDVQVLNEFSTAVASELDLAELFPLIHQQLMRVFGEVSFYIALYDEVTDSIEIPYVWEKGETQQIDPFPLGEGLTSIVIRSKEPLMLVENAVERARELGARLVGEPAKSWMGVPLISQGNVIGIMTVQDVEQENRFDENDLRLMSTLAGQAAGIIRNSVLLAQEQRRAVQLQTTAEIARDISGTYELEALLSRAVNLIRDRFNFYHASVFLMDKAGMYAVVRESTGEAGAQMKADRHQLEVGSQSIIGYVTQNHQSLVVNDVSTEPNHRFNPLLPDTRSEVGIPMMVGDRLVGAIDVQSIQPYAFSPDDVEILETLADLMAVAISNAELFSETQEHLAQHRLIHNVTTVAASGSSLLDSLNSAVQGLRAALGDRVSILLFDPKSRQLTVRAAAGYSDDVMGFSVPIGEGITGWVAQHEEPAMINNVLNDVRYIPGAEAVRSEVAVPLVYRGELQGVLNVESDEFNTFTQRDLDVLGTLAGSLGAIIVNARLSDRQRQLFEVTNKIRRSSNMESILETTAQELSRTLRTRRARVEVSQQAVMARTANAPAGENGGDGELTNGDLGAESAFDGGNGLPDAPMTSEDENA